MRIGGLEFDITEEEYERFKDYLIKSRTEETVLKELKTAIIQANTGKSGKGGNGGESGRRDFIYTRELYRSGLIQKIESVTLHPHKFATKELVKFFYSLGMQSKEIAYQFYSMGIPRFEYAIKRHIDHNLKEFEAERERMLSLIQNTQRDVFQGFQKEYYALEAGTLRIYIKSIQKLQKILEEIDPDKEPAKFSRVMNQIETLQNKIKDAHGINGYRQAQIEATKEIFIAREKHKIEHGDPDTSNVNGKKEIQHFMELDVETLDVPNSSSESQTSP